VPFAVYSLGFVGSFGFGFIGLTLLGSAGNIRVSLTPSAGGARCWGFAKFGQVDRQLEGVSDTPTGGGTKLFALLA